MAPKPTLPRIFPGMTVMEQVAATFPCLAWFDDPLRSRLHAKMDEVAALLHARESKGITYWDTRSASYAVNLMSVHGSLFGGLLEYVKRAATIEQGRRRYKQHYLEVVLDRLLLPALEIDLSVPLYHPINPDVFPNYFPERNRRNELGRKINNSHQVDGEDVWLEWDSQGLEPSHWHSFCGKASGLSELSPADAVAKAKLQAAKWALAHQEHHSKQYSPAELERMPGFLLRIIAGKRRLAIPKSNRLKDIRAIISQPQLPLLED